MSRLYKAIEAFKELKPEEADDVIMQLLSEEKIDIPALVSVYARNLANFKHNAQNDIRKLAEAGLMLGEKEIGRIKSAKSGRKKELHTALAHTLLTAGYRGTEYNKKLSAQIDMSIVDKGWYEDCWALETVPTQTKVSDIGNK